MHAMEITNRRTWRNPLALRDYRRSSGYLNDGERRIMQIGAEGRGAGRVLDIGVGGGRTTALLRPLATTYTGIDYTPEMIALARANHPDRTFLLMDARDLRPFASAAFDLVVFSYNGIDSVDPDGRRAVMAEVGRVLAPGGLFLFSTFHRNWRGFWTPANARLRMSANPLRLGVRVVRYGLGVYRSWRLRPSEVRSGEHAILLHGAHDFGIMAYATTPEQLAGQLAAAGFAAPPRLFGIDGTELFGQVSPDHEYFHVIARKPPAG